MHHASFHVAKVKLKKSRLKILFGCRDNTVQSLNQKKKHPSLWSVSCRLYRWGAPNEFIRTAFLPIHARLNSRPGEFGVWIKRHSQPQASWSTFLHWTHPILRLMQKWHAEAFWIFAFSFSFSHFFFFFRTSNPSTIHHPSTNLIRPRACFGTLAGAKSLFDIQNPMCIYMLTFIARTMVRWFSEGTHGGTVGDGETAWYLIAGGVWFKSIDFWSWTRVIRHIF